MERKITRDFDLVFDGVNLRAFEKTIDGKQVKVLSGTASSTAKDLCGSIIGPACQVKMLEKLQALAAQMSSKNSGLTAWLNHSYKIPEDPLGAFVGASLTTREENGESYIDLDIECRVTETNPRAVAAWEQVKDGIRHGWSIGAYFLDVAWASDNPDSDDYWTLLVNDIDLLEISLVGIPANQRAWCRSADDLKSMAVQVAEDIVREAKADAGAVAQRFGVPVEQLREAPEVRAREFTIRSLIGEREAPQAPVEPAVAAAPTEQAEDFQQTLHEVVTAAATFQSVAASAVGWNVESVTDGTPDLCAALRTGEPNKELNEQAATAIEILSQAAAAQRALEARDPSGGDGEPMLYSKEQISKAIAFCAKGVGHGLCIRSAAHIGNAIGCLAAAIGNEVDQPGPTGDQDPGEMMSAVLKLEPKAGDVVVVQFNGEATEALEAARQAIADELKSRDVSVLFVSDTLAVSIDNELATKAEQLQQAQSQLADVQRQTTEAETLATQFVESIDARKAEAEDLAAQIEARQAELAALDARIAEAQRRRLGRMGVNDMLRDTTQSSVRPEHYARSSTEQLSAIKRMVNGDSPPSGRDIALVP